MAPVLTANGVARCESQIHQFCSKNKLGEENENHKNYRTDK